MVLHDRSRAQENSSRPLKGTSTYDVTIATSQYFSPVQAVKESSGISTLTQILGEKANWPSLVYF